MCLNVLSVVRDTGTEYMFMALSAEEVARRAMSGENLRHVIPLACARGSVTKGVKVRDLGFCTTGEAEGGGDCDSERDRRGEYVSLLVLDLDLDLDRRDLPVWCSGAESYAEVPVGLRLSRLLRAAERLRLRDRSCRGVSSSRLRLRELEYSRSRRVSRAERVESSWRRGAGWDRGCSAVELREEEESALDVRRRLGAG